MALCVYGAVGWALALEGLPRPNSLQWQATITRYCVPDAEGYRARNQPYNKQRLRPNKAADKEPCNHCGDVENKSDDPELKSNEPEKFWPIRQACSQR